MGKRTRSVAAAAATAVLCCLAVGMFPAAAGADLLATVEVPSSDGTNLDLATFDTATGQRVSDLGASAANTSANEFHASIVGHRLAFERLQGGAIHIIVRDTFASQQADVFNGFDAAADQPNDPVLALDGNSVITGSVTHNTCPTLISTPLSAFPAGPFTHSPVFATTINGASLACIGGVTSTTRQPLVVGSNPLAVLFGWDLGGPRTIDRITGQQLSNSLCSTSPCSSGEESVQDPAMAPGGSPLVFEVVGPALRAGDPAPGLYFTSTTAAGFGPITKLPSPINGVSGARETRPAFSSDGRYLAFVRHDLTTGREHLFVWDSQTQLLLSTSGIDLGTLSGSLASLALTDGDIVLINQSLIVTTTVCACGQIGFTLVNPSNIGIIVQKVVGHTRVFGRPAPKLRFVGRVPLGHFRRGHGHIRWDLKVGGRALSPGLYQVTVRSVTPSLGIRDLGHPALIRIKAHH